MRIKRYDLQGLRALAVAGVVAYHFGVPPFSGGFVGVDVFFVLSGYFITRMLLTEAVENGRIDLLKFWGNRIKRLLPNGLLVITATTLVALVIFPTYRSQTVLADATAAALFVANLHFAFAAVDYFQLGAPPSPLLHFWSLSVEEQFYMVTPFILSVALLAAPRKHPIRTFAVTLGIIAIASFVAAILAVSSNQPAAFYLSPYRAWQLAAGGLVGLLSSPSASQSSRLAGLGAWVGCLLILGSYVLLSEAMIYPGYWALLPTAGTVLLLIGLESNDATLLRRFFSLRPFVWLGDTSYSVYLWHWPIVVFLAATTPDGGAAVVAIGLLLTIGLSSVAFMVVERPLHQRSLASLGLKRVFAAGAGATFLTVLVTLGAGSVPGRTERVVAERIEVARNDLGPNYLNGCHLSYDETDQPTCLSGKPNSPRVVLFGDSHAAQWFNAVDRAAQIEGWTLQTWTKTSCPAADVTVWYEPKQSTYQACDVWRAERMTDLLAEPPELVILASSSRYFDWIFDPEMGERARPERVGALWSEGADGLARMLISHGIPAVQIVDTPEMNATYQDCLSEQSWDKCGRERSPALAGLPLATSLPSINLTSQLCGTDMCEPVVDGEIAYRDQFHITATFAANLYPAFADLLRSVSQPE